MCWIFSLAWSQKGQAAGWGRPLLVRWSLVQHPLLRASQRWGRPLLARRSAVQCCWEQTKQNICILEEPNNSKLFSKEQTWWSPEKKMAHADLLLRNPNWSISTDVDQQPRVARSSHPPGPKEENIHSLLYMTIFYASSLCSLVDKWCNELLKIIELFICWMLYESECW